MLPTPALDWTPVIPAQAPPAASPGPVFSLPSAPPASDSLVLTQTTPERPVQTTASSIAPNPPPNPPAAASLDTGTIAKASPGLLDDLGERLHHSSRQGMYNFFMNPVLGGLDLATTLIYWASLPPYKAAELLDWRSYYQQLRSIKGLGFLPKTSGLIEGASRFFHNQSWLKSLANLSKNVRYDRFKTVLMTISGTATLIHLTWGYLQGFVQKRSNQIKLGISPQGSAPTNAKTSERQSLFQQRVREAYKAGTDLSMTHRIMTPLNMVLTLLWSMSFHEALPLARYRSILSPVALGAGLAPMIYGFIRGFRQSADKLLYSVDRTPPVITRPQTPEKPVGIADA